MGFVRPTDGTQEFQNNRIDLRLRMLISPSICWPLGTPLNHSIPLRAMSLDSPIPLRTAPLSLLQRLALLHGHLKHFIKRAADEQELRFQYLLPTRLQCSLG